jgi:hypothetical protein
LQFFVVGQLPVVDQLLIEPMKQRAIVPGVPAIEDMCAFTWRFYWATCEEATALA